MCFVSYVSTVYDPHIPQPTAIPYPYFPKVNTGTTTNAIEIPVKLDLSELRELIESFKQAIAAAKVFDRLTGQPDCVDPEKAKLQDRVAELERRLESIGV